MQNQSGDSINNKISDMDWSIGGGGGGAGGYHSSSRSGGVCRFGSSSSQTSQNSGDICRICHCESETQNPLLTPCYCSGSLKYVHQSCLQQWLTASETTSCELCKFPFIMHTKIKPFNEWRALQMSGIERRRLFCSVLFHCAAATCVIWSLCVLIERATEEVKKGLISWPFWTKLVVVTVGLTGGIVFMYIQCKAYLSLCTRWRARNRILLIQNAPEKVAPPPQEPTALRDSPPLMFNRPTAASVGGGSTGTPGRLSNTSGMGTQVSTMALNRSVYSAASHGQIVANIESNSSQMSGGNRQSRDWTNVYVEDMAFHAAGGDEGGFRPEDAVAGVSTKGGGAVHTTTFKVHQMHHLNQHHPPAQAVPPSTAIFVENQDILSDTQPEICSRRLFDEHQLMQQQLQQHLDQEHFPSRSKFNRHRHSVWVDSGPMVMNASTAAKHNQSDFRRYSDTRLIMEPQDYEHQQHIFNVACQSSNNTNKDSARTGGVGLDGGGTAIDMEDDPQITDILFESADHGSSFDPLELNIQELLELDIRTNVRGGGGGGASAALGQREGDEFRSSQMSVNSDPQKYFKGDGQTRVDRVATPAEQKHLLTPQSLPNLSASSEDLFQQQRQPQQQHQQQFQ